MTNTPTMNSNERPYKPSLIDRFTNWVDKLPIQVWVFYVSLGFLLILSQMLFLWLEGGLHARMLLPLIIFNGFAIPFILVLIHFLDNQAVTALNSMMPTLDMDELDYSKFQYMLSNMPSRGMAIAGLAVMVFFIIVEWLAIVPISYAALEQLPIFKMVYQVFDKSSAFLYGVFVYHTIRQLRLVNNINTNHIRINLFNLGPAQAFSRLTASTAVGLVVGVYVWMLINPELLTNLINFGVVGLITILAVAVFVWPLLGAHRLMEEEKGRMLHEIDLQFEVVFSKFNQRIRADDYSTIKHLNESITSLDIQHKRIKAIPTWPWKPETARFALSAIALPFILRILQFLVERAF